MSKLYRGILYLCVGLVSFVFFLYFSFPYQVLKEAISSQVSEASGVAFSMSHLKPKLLMGFEGQDAEVTAPGGRKISLKVVSANLILWKVLLGKIGAELYVLDAQGGSFEVYAIFNIFDLIMERGAAPPAVLLVTSNKFQIGDIVNFLIAKKAQDPDTDVLIKPLFQELEFAGKLNANIDLTIDSKDIGQSKGKAQINFLDTSLSFDSKLQIPNQKFDKALIMATFENGLLQLDKKSEISSSDLIIAMNGKIEQKPQIEKSVLDLNLDVELLGPLNDQFGFVLDAIAKRSAAGKIKVKISGPLSPSPQVNIL